MKRFWIDTYTGDVNEAGEAVAEARTPEAEAEAWTPEAEAEARTLEAEARTLEAEAEAEAWALKAKAEAWILETECTFHYFTFTNANYFMIKSILWYCLSTDLITVLI